MQREIREKIEPIQAEKQQARQQAKQIKSEVKQTRSKLNVKKVRAPVTLNPMRPEDPIPLEVHAHVPTLKESLEVFEKEAVLKRRNVSDSSVESATIHLAKQQKTAGSKVQTSVEFEYFQKLGERINAKIDVVKHLAHHRNTELQKLSDAKAKSLIGQRQYYRTAEALEGQLTHLRMELVGLKRNSGMIRGTAIDRCRQLVAMKDTTASTDMLMDNLVHTVKIEPALWTSRPEVDSSGSDPREGQQSQFRQSLIKYYDAEREEDEDDGECYETVKTETYSDIKIDTPMVWSSVRQQYVKHKQPKLYWCPIMQGYYEGENMKVTHIVPFGIGEMNCAYLFGPNDRDENGEVQEHLFDWRNGLLLRSDMEVALDKARIAIVPCHESGGSADQLKVVVINKSITRVSGCEDLTDKVLIFRNSNRPRLRYLYFNMIMTVFRRRRYECTGWRNDLCNYAKSTMWGSPGKKWIRGSTIRTMARKIGHETDLEKFFGTSDLLLDDNEDRRSGSEDEVVADEIFGVVQKDDVFRAQPTWITPDTDDSEDDKIEYD